MVFNRNCPVPWKSLEQSAPGRVRNNLHQTHRQTHNEERVIFPDAVRANLRVNYGDSDKKIRRKRKDAEVRLKPVMKENLDKRNEIAFHHSMLVIGEELLDRPVRRAHHERRQDFERNTRLCTNINARLPVQAGHRLPKPWTVVKNYPTRYLPRK